MAHELANRGAIVRTEVVIPIIYKGLQVEKGYRADLIVNEHVVVELKVVEKILPVHRIQLLSYLRLGDFRLGYLLNFRGDHMRNGITRLANGL
jgi:GxxExxY protein